MPIRSLPEELYADAVALWHTAELTPPWNDPSADLRRAMTGTASTVLAALDEQAGLLGPQWWDTTAIAGGPTTWPCAPIGNAGESAGT